MTDYISREAAIEKLKEERNYTGKFSFEEEHAWSVGFQQGISFALSDIASLPAADVRPVVLCGVCELHGHCYTEDIFAFARLSEGNRFCPVGKVKTNGEKREES